MFFFFLRQNSSPLEEARCQSERQHRGPGGISAEMFPIDVQGPPSQSNGKRRDKISIFTDESIFKKIEL